MLKKASVLLVFLLPLSLIVLIKVSPAKLQPVSDQNVVSEAEARRIESAERRAERAEARKEKRAIRQAKENERRSLEESEQWFAGNDERFGLGEPWEEDGFEGNPAFGMMPLPMPPVLPNMAYGRMRGGRGFGGGDGFDDPGYIRNEEFDGSGAYDFGNGPGDGFIRF